MFSTSEAYKNLAHTDGCDWNGKAHIVLANGTILDITNSDIMTGGIAVEAGTSEQGAFTIGGAVIDELTLVLNNFEGKFTQYDFTDAVIYPYSGLTTQVHWRDGKIIEWIPFGECKTDNAKTVGSTIQIIALNNMEKFDRPYTTSTLVYPATLANIVADACVRCGVSNNAITFTNSTYVVTTKPSSDSMTYREVISYAAELAGCFAIINRTTYALEFSWYDFDRFTVPLPTGKVAPAELRKSINYDIATSDITITGVQIIPKTSDGNQYIHGAEGYVVKIDSNPLAQSNLQALVDSIGTKIVGMTFTPYTVSTYPDPSIDSGDVVLVTDKKGNIHKSFVSTISYMIGTSESFTADAETVSENQSTKFSAVDKAQEAADTAQTSADAAQTTADEATASITATNGVVALKASKASLISEINVCPESITINTNKLNITGLVTISNLENGNTTIDGACITTGRIESENGDYWVDLTTGEVYMKNGTFSGKIDWGGSDNFIKMIDGKLYIACANDIDINGSSGVGEVNIHVINSYSVSASIGSFDTLNGATGKTGDLGITRSDGSTRTLHFTRGILDSFG